MASRLWRFLTTDISELFSIDTVSITADKAESIFGLAAVLEKEGSEVEKLAPLVNQLDSLLDVLNSPLAKIVEKSLPFVSIATELLKFYFEKSKKKLTLANCFALVIQAAYLESFKKFLRDDKALLQQVGEVPVSENVSRQTRQLAELELTDEEARRAINSFPSSTLSKTFGQVLYARLIQAGLSEEAGRTLVERVTWFTPRYIDEVWAACPEAVKQLALTFKDWRQEQAKYQDIDDYLEKVIRTKPKKTVFNEKSLTFRDIYVSLQIKRLDRDGKPIKDEPLHDLETWVINHLMKADEKPTILFIQGEAGRGKSVFCRMFADRVRKSLYPAYIPILIRLRHIKTLESSLTEILTNCLETRDFVRSNSNWLTDNNTRFLFLLDGFDEFFLERGASGELKEFLHLVEAFQNDSHHRFLITGRPLALQGIDRLSSQGDCLERVELQPMCDELREIWYQRWATKFGQPETDNFKNFLSVCPRDVNDLLAREPLLLYLLGRMHREQQLRADMFAGAEGLDAKIIIYDEVVRWVIKEQRQDENFRLTGLEKEDLRHVLLEAAVCVVQSGNNVAKIAFLESRLEDDDNRVYELWQKARREKDAVSEKKEKKLLNNLLTTFYIKPASDDPEGSVEFTHKSFVEFLFAERLNNALKGWSQKGILRGERCLVPDEEMWREIYDLLGYGSLTPEVMDYLRVVLSKDNKFDPILLFERLYDVYLRWWSGEFIDALSDNLPQAKMRRLQKQIPDREAPLGLKQVDAYVGFNIMILLFELHRYGQSTDYLKNSLAFYPCGEPDTDRFDEDRLLRIIGYGECLSAGGFHRFVTPYLFKTDISGVNLHMANLSGANLSGANLSGTVLDRANLCSADLSGANLSRASFFRADLLEANLLGANLSEAFLAKANLSGANLSGADLSGANLLEANFSDSYIKSDRSKNGFYFFRFNPGMAFLAKANLSGANLSGANLCGVILTNADLSGVKWNLRTQWANAEMLHETRNIPPELHYEPGFAAAFILSKGMNHAEKGEIRSAIDAFNQAQTIDPTIKISALSWANLCWFGSLYGDAKDVLFAGEKAVNLSTGYKVVYQISRGLARALTGDLAGALADFQPLLNSPILLGITNAQRERWLKALQAGENPFTTEELDSLREEAKKDQIEVQKELGSLCEEAEKC